MTPERPMLQVELGQVQYGLVTAVSGIALDVAQGETVAVLGPNGAGKTSLLKGIVGAVRTRDRHLYLSGNDCTRVPTWKLAHLGLIYVPDGARCFPELTAEENLLIIAGNDPDTAQRLEEVWALFPRLRTRRQQQAHVLSGGERQMLAIARGFLLSPRILLIDEPSSGLAPIVVSEVYRVIETLRREKGIGILLAEQNVKLAMEVSQRLILLEQGKVVRQGATKEFTLDVLETAYLGTAAVGKE